jgi:hypothetical protein
LLANDLYLRDTNQSNSLQIVWNENDTADRTLSLLVAGGNRSLTLNEDFTIGDGFSGTLTYSVAGKTLTIAESSTIDQNLSTLSSPTFAGLTLNGGIIANNAFDIDVDDNQAGAFTISQGANNYLDLSTVTGSESLSFGNATTDPDFNFLGSGAVSIAGTFQLANGQTGINEISNDDTLADASEIALVTEYAVKNYVDNQLGTANYWDKLGEVLSPKDGEPIAATSSATTVATFTATGTNLAFQAGGETGFATIDSLGNITGTSVYLKDSAADNTLRLLTDQDLNANYSLTFRVTNANRILTLGADVSLNQNLRTDSSPLLPT